MLPSDVITLIHVYGAVSVVAGLFAPSIDEPAPVELVPLNRGIADRIILPVPVGVSVIPAFVPAVLIVVCPLDVTDR